LQICYYDGNKRYLPLSSDILDANVKAGKPAVFHASKPAGHTKLLRFEYLFNVKVLDITKAERISASLNSSEIKDMTWESFVNKVFSKPSSVIWYQPSYAKNGLLALYINTYKDMKLSEMVFSYDDLSSKTNLFVDMTQSKQVVFYELDTREDMRRFFKDKCKYGGKTGSVVVKKDCNKTS
jgi:hypothetical protein